MPSLANVLHVSADFPDAIEPGKTTAIRSLIDLTRDAYAHEVISLNRRSPRWLDFVPELARGRVRDALMLEKQPMALGEAWIYRAPGKGILHHTTLRALGSEIAERAKGTAVIPDLIVGHKLTVEGIAVAHAAARLGVPYGLTIQGDTDTKILAARPDLAGKLGNVFHQAAMVVSFAPWSLVEVEHRLGKRTGHSAVIPCATELDSILEPRAPGSGLVSVFHLKNHRRKNLAAMAEALNLLRQGECPDASLAIVGGGTEEDRLAARACAGDNGAIEFEGPLHRSAVASRLNRATCLVMPSRRESFGMVFVEALFAGCPVIYPRDRAVAGFLDDLPFAIAVDPASPQSIAAAMRRAIVEEQELKAALAHWQASGGLERFTRQAIGQAYTLSIAAALGGPQ